MSHSEYGINKFFAIARERYQIKLNRDAGLSRPWSKDPIFQKNRFCNVFREDDKTTIWFRKNIRDPLNQSSIHPATLLFSIVAFRWFNRIETFESLFKACAQKLNPDPLAMFSNWHRAMEQEFLNHVTPPWVTGAYIIKTPDGMNKLEGVLWCLEQFQQLMKSHQFDLILDGVASMKKACELLQTVPYLGRFSSYQICADAQRTRLLENAPDIYTWAQPGPGSTRGIGRVFYNDVDKFKYGSMKDEQEVIELFKILITQSENSEYWPSGWPSWDAQTCQNFNCEFDKYCRAEEGGHMKRKFG